MLVDYAAHFNEHIAIDARTEVAGMDDKSGAVGTMMGPETITGRGIVLTIILVERNVEDAVDFPYAIVAVIAQIVATGKDNNRE